MKTYSHARVIAAAVVLLSAVQPVLAGTANTTFQVTANTIEACTSISADPVSFGSYSQSATIKTNMIVMVSCSSGLPYTVGLLSGNSQDSTTNAKKYMIDGTSDSIQLLYTIVQPNNTTWGNLAGSGGNVYSAIGTGVQQTIVGTASLPPMAAGVPSGLTFTDSVTATVSW